MKRILTFFFALFAVFGTWAAAELPQFSTVENPVWYSVQFKTGGAFLADQGTGNNLKTEKLSFADQQSWQFIGTQDKFVMRSKAGNYVNFANSKFNAAAEGVDLKLVQSTNKDASDCWEINRIGSAQNMNQYQGAGAGKELSEWTPGDENNPLMIKPAETLFSTVENPKWMRLKFNAGGNYIAEKALDDLLTTKADNAKDQSQVWQFIGTAEQFQLRNQLDHFINYNGSRFTVQTEGVNFKLHQADNGWNLQREGSSQGMNQYQKTEPGIELAEWTLGDGNNALTFEVYTAPVPLNNLPVFSTAENPEWYLLQFKKGSAFLKDMGNDNKLTTAEKEKGNAEKWQFIGNEDNFKMKSKAGNYVSFKANRFHASQDENAAVQLQFIQNSDNQSLEMRVVGESQCMNQSGGAGAGKELGKWTAGDENNPFSLFSIQPAYPLFSQDNAEPTWYFIQFKNGMNVLADQGDGNAVRTATAEPIEGQLWKLVGTPEKFQMMNQLGNYLVVSDLAEGRNNTPVRTAKAPFEPGFRLVATDSKYLPAWEIQVANSQDNKSFNQFGGAKRGNTIGIWDVNDENNPLQFIAKQDMVYLDFKSTPAEAYVPEHDLTLWYTAPATTAPLFTFDNWYSNWMEYSLPIGDGQFGGSLFGGIAKDEILFNEKTLWSGSPSEYGKYEVFGSVFAQYIGDDIDYTSSKGAEQYVRQLDLTTATGMVAFSSKDSTRYTREYIASHPAHVIAARYTANKAGKINLLFTMESAKPGVTATTTYEADGGMFSGKLKTIKYNARFKVVKVGEAGTITSSDKGVEVRDADEVILILAGGTDYDPTSNTYVSSTMDLNGDIQKRVNDAANTGWSNLYQAHVADHQKFFNRVDFQLAGTENRIPTNVMVDTYNKGEGQNALMLEQLYFAYGRYLEIASSRGVDLPNNLQGIWCNNQSPAWQCDIHANINVQMNYWPAETTNLSEMHLPFLKYISRMANSEQWKQNAQDSGQPEGWTCYTENNIFGGGGGFAKNYVIANAWYCTHLWQHYRYTLDKEYLKEVFPAMWSASRFWITRLKKLDLPNGGYEYVCPDEYSPEHGPGKEDGVAHAQQLVWDLLDNTAQAVKELEGQLPAEVTQELLNTHNDYLIHLDKGLATETYNGEWGNAVTTGYQLLREWKYSDYTKGANGHRHMSHLMCLYPFSQVTPGTELYDAAVNSLTLRGDGATGWSMGWKINLWARAQDGDHARRILSNALAHANHSSGVYYNLFDAHNPFQIDGNFGACSGIAEMIMQSNDGIVRILPALPKAWTRGCMKGLKAVGDFTVDVEWYENKAVTEGTQIVSNKGQVLKINYPGLATMPVLVNGNEVKVKELDNNTVELNTQVGDVITIAFDAKKTVSGSFEIKTAEGFATHYTDKAFRMPQGVMGTTVKAVDAGNGIGTLVTDWEFQSGHIVPAATPVLLHGEKGVYEYQVVDTIAAPATPNLLKGSLADAQTEGEGKFYKLAYSMVNGQKTLGFFWGADNGAAFVNKAGKAYLALPANVQAQGFRLSDLVTGVENVETEVPAIKVVYNLAGVRMNSDVNALPQGVYIVNGKKVIIK